MKNAFMDYPFTIDNRGGVGVTDEDDHIRDMIEQVLFTNPGERVNRPDFGCGLRRMVFTGGKYHDWFMLGMTLEEFEVADRRRGTAALEDA